jgi:hypothetical protein
LGHSQKKPTPESLPIPLSFFASPITKDFTFGTFPKCNNLLVQSTPYLWIRCVLLLFVLGCRRWTMLWRAASHNACPHPHPLALLAGCLFALMIDLGHAVACHISGMKMIVEQLTDGTSNNVKEEASGEGEKQGRIEGAENK